MSKLLAALGWTAAVAPNVIVFIAHPDDETIGLGGHLNELTNVAVVHATDGAPRNLSDARAKGFADAAAYAQARRGELQRAMALVGVDASALLEFGCSDQEAARHLPELTRRLADLSAARRADLIFTHAYEGGHPDHDAVAFAAHAAVALLRRQGAATPWLVEMPLYHSQQGVPVRQRFAPHPALKVAEFALGPVERERKQRMFACHASQRETLELFHVERECFRIAPSYDFRARPNGGEIFYESFGWDFAGADFLALASAALDEMDLPASL